MMTRWAVAKGGRVSHEQAIALIAACCVTLLICVPIYGQAPALPAGPQNLGFADGQSGSTPPGWRVSARGYTAQITSECGKPGRNCAILSRNSDADPLEFGNLSQAVDAAPYRGKRVRFRAAVRNDVTASRDRAQLWLRVDLPGNAMGFFDNMQNRPIENAEWKYYEIVGDVADDAQRIIFGVILATGSATPPTGKLWIDDASFEVLGDTPRTQIDAPAPLNARGLENEIAFARLFGLIKFFHPSDAAAQADWNALAISGARSVESAKDANELAQKLTTIFAPVAPTLRVLPASAKYELPLELRMTAASEKNQVTHWKHHGMGIGSTQASIYHSERVREAFRADATTPVPQKPWEADLGGGVKAWVPIALYVAADGTVPPAAPKSETNPLGPPNWTAKDRATRMADVVIAWSVAQHFYPYFDVVKTDWPAALRTALQSAATDTDEDAFELTLQKLVAQLHDGHGGIYHGVAALRLPVAWDWVENRLVITAVKPDVTGLAPGDAVLKIDGRAVADLIAEREARISGATPQWIRWRALQDLLMHTSPKTSVQSVTAQIEIEPFADQGKTRVVSMTYEPSRDIVQEKRPEKIAEIEPGVMYMDISRLTDADFAGAIEKLQNAKGIVVDFRGYPRLGPKYLQYFSDKSMTSAQWHVPVVVWPDGKDMKFERGGEWSLTPLSPFLTARKAFITDGRAISYAESCMGIVENYRIGEIVGAPTAGTNGNVNPVQLPGGYSMSWTGMKVLKHDGSKHHGVGIQPTIPLQRTRAAIAAGRDEFLEAAIKAVQPTEIAKSQP